MAFSITYYDNIRYHRMDFINRDLDFFGNGVVATSDFPLTFPTTPNMTATIGQGRAWVDGYRIANDSNPVTINFLAADPTNPRIDIIQLGHDDINSTYSLQVKKGVAAASPVEPNADPGYVKLYAINVAANATSISASNIIDRRGLVPLNVSATQISLGGSAGTNQNNTFNAGYTQTFNGPVVANSTLTTKNSTLDDGSGNATFGGSASFDHNVSFRNNGTTNSIIASDDLFIVPASGKSIGFVNNAQSSWGLKVVEGNNPATFTNKNTLDDGNGNATFAGTINTTAGVVESVNNLTVASPSTIIKSSASGGSVSFQNNNGTTGLMLNSTSLSLTSFKNTLDDGNGLANLNMVQTRIGTASGGQLHHELMNGSSLRIGLGLLNTEGGSNSGSDFSVYAYDDTGTYLSRPLTITRSNGAVNTIHNTLDDGSGNATFGGYVKSKQLISDGTNSLKIDGNGMDVQLASTSGFVGITDGGHTAWKFYYDTVKSEIHSNVPVYSQHNTLDDGNGNANFYGTGTFTNGTIMSSGTATSTSDVWSSALNFHSSHWNGTAAVSNNLYLQADNLGGLYIASNGSGSSKEIFSVGNTGTGRFYGGLYTNNNTLDDGSGNMAINGHAVLNAIGTATSSSNNASQSLWFSRSSWNGSAAVTGTSALYVDGSGTLRFNNESSTNIFSLSQTGGLYSVKNILDDGSGNSTFSGATTLNGNLTMTSATATSSSDYWSAPIYFHSSHWNGSAAVNISSWLQTDNLGGITFGSNGSGANTTTFTVNNAGKGTFAGGLSTVKNTLDDGTGAATFAGAVTSNASVFAFSGSKQVYVRAGSAGSWLSDSVTGDSIFRNDETSTFRFGNNGGVSQFSIVGSTVKTLKNQLDDGTGKSIFSGLATFNNNLNVSASGTATSTNDYWSSALNFYGSHWNGSTAVSNYSFIQGDPNGGFNVFSNTIGQNTPTFKVDQSGNGSLLGSLFMNSNNAGIEIGSQSAANSPYIDFHSSGAANDYNARIVASGGSTTTSINGDGDLNILSSTLHHNGNLITSVADFNNSLSGNGYQKLPNGLIIQWARVQNVPNATMTSYALPIAFPNNLLQATVSVFNADGRAAWNYVSASQIGLYQDSGAAAQMSYIAIGY